MEGTPLTLKDAVNALHSASPMWYQIGVQLEVPSYVLKNIKQEYPYQMDRLTGLLDFWMKNATDPPPSWRALIDALKASAVGEKRLAGELEKKYCERKDSRLHNQGGACRMRANQVRVLGNQIHAPVLVSSTTNIATMALSKDPRCSNGVPKTHIVSRSVAGFRSASGFVVAIDFRRTHCSVVYSEPQSKEILKLGIDGLYTRVPVAILIERGTNAVEGFGFCAQTKFSMIRKENRDKYIYFELKMILYHRLDVSRTTPISPINSDEEYYLVDVVALILKYLKDKLYNSLHMSGCGTSKIQFDWVVTVPAIWDNRGKQMMREAAYKAGLCSSSPSCSLIPYSKSRKLERPVETAPDRLSLALEPEVAGLYCQNRDEFHFKPQCFMVLNIGGSTVDITSYHIDKEGHLCVNDKVNECGGTQVNEQFSRFLQTIVNDPDFRQYLNVPNAQLQQQHRADLNKLIYGSFEYVKKLFGDEGDDKKRYPAQIHIPKSFVKFYNQEKLERTINQKYNNIAELDGLELCIEPKKMKEFFQPVIEQVRHHAFLALERFKREVGKPETIYLLGGFGGCEFVKKALQDIMRERYGRQLEVYVPLEHKLAVACGAVKFRRNPEITWARKAEHTYGYVVNSPFDPDIHDPAYKMKNEEGKDYCRDLFQPFIEIGDTICADKVLQSSITPFRSSMPRMMVTIYSTNERNIWYARDKDGKLVSGLKQVGTLVFDFLRYSDDKRVVLTIDLSATEIHLKAHHEKTGEEVKMVLDYP